MKVLVVGGGGREHALAWKAAQSTRVETVFVAPGNAGTGREKKVQNLDIGATDISNLLRFALDEAIDLTIVGPEAPLVAGIVDAFRADGLRCFGPTMINAQLEGSKAFTKAFLKSNKIPTAEYECFNDYDLAEKYIRARGAPIVVKADGLAAGKGVIVAQSVDQALDAARGMLLDKRFGSAGRNIIVEECLVGEEASFICMVDGEHVLPLASSQDHKARDDGDVGPNTGGMGAYSPASLVTRDLHDRIMNEIIRPTVRGLAAEGTPYVGFLYAGLMIDDSGSPRVLEYNCRFGDPEAQPILLRLKSDLVDLCEAAINGELDQQVAHWDPRSALGVVMAAEGYPEDYPKGDVIEGIDDADSDIVKVFLAGAQEENGKVVTNGGRVLCVTALGETVTEAQQNAYQALEKIRWSGAYYRTDIGFRAIAREQRIYSEHRHGGGR